jgi:hypothetical protein
MFSAYSLQTVGHPVVSSFIVQPLLKPPKNREEGLLITTSVLTKYLFSEIFCQDLSCD